MRAEKLPVTIGRSSADSFFGLLPFPGPLVSDSNLSAAAAFGDSLQFDSNRQRTKTGLAIPNAVDSVLAADWG